MNYKEKYLQLKKQYGGATYEALILLKLCKKI